MSFHFSGSLEISKSWMNRALILQSYNSAIQIHGESSADDVVLLKKALADFKNGKTEFQVGLGGTTLRFLALRLSRASGEFTIFGDEKLFSRPQTELIHVLNQLGVIAELSKNSLKIKSEGWKRPTKLIQISTQQSSQFLSSFVLNAMDLDFDLQYQTSQQITSEGYYQYTLDLIKKCGVDVSDQKMRSQKLKPTVLKGEIDISSAFSLIAAGVLSGDVEIKNWSDKSLQPDMQFVQFLKEMNISFSFDESEFRIKQQAGFKNLQANLKNCPDLFPVLSVLCAFAEGESHLFGAHQLIHKESNRIQKTYDLLTRCGLKAELQNDGLKIQGNPNAKYRTKDLIHFDPDGDHRMAFAAAILQIKGFPIVITEPNVITKSYPQFYQHIGLDYLL